MPIHSFIKTIFLSTSFSSFPAATDFVTDEISVILPPTDKRRGDTVNLLVPIIDDAINERSESFVGYIELVDATDTSTIEFGLRATQLVINDNDGTITLVSLNLTAL